MTEGDGEQGEARDERRPDASRPTTAAARRQRRRAATGTASGAGQDTAGRGSRSSARGRHAADPDGSEGATNGSATRAARATTEKKGRPTPSRDSKEKTEKRSIFERIGRFLREVVAELRKVIWPNRRQMITYTSVVLVFIIVMTAFIFGLDYGFTKAIFAIFG